MMQILVQFLDGTVLYASSVDDTELTLRDVQQIADTKGVEAVSILAYTPMKEVRVVN